MRRKNNILVLGFIVASLAHPSITEGQDSPRPSTSSESIFNELAKLEIENDVIANSAYESLDLDNFLTKSGISLNQPYLPSEEEQDKLRSVFKNIVFFMVKEATSQTFWEKNLSDFLIKNFNAQEVEEVFKIYPVLDQVHTGRKLLQLRPQFVSEVLPLWQQVMKERTQSFKLPAGSMFPTLLIGDHILIDKFSYQFKKPERGDIVAFRYPEDEAKKFIKRIVGVPGETVEIRDKITYVNSQPLEDKAYTQRIDPSVIDGAINPRDNFGPVIVPQDSYFVLGDNRDQSLDSRFWGYVRTGNIIGKASIIYWSWGTDGARWERIGMKLQ